MAGTSRYWPLLGDTRCVSRVPASGVQEGYLTGQVTRAFSLSTGAARSEPHMDPGR